MFFLKIIYFYLFLAAFGSWSLHACCLQSQRPGVTLLCPVSSFLLVVLVSLWHLDVTHIWIPQPRDFKKPENKHPAFRWYTRGNCHWLRGQEVQRFNCFFNRLSTSLSAFSLIFIFPCVIIWVYQFLSLWCSVFELYYSRLGLSCLQVAMATTSFYLCSSLQHVPVFPTPLDYHCPGRFISS